MLSKDLFETLQTSLILKGETEENGVLFHLYVDPNLCFTLLFNSANVNLPVLSVHLKKSLSPE